MNSKRNINSIENNPFDIWLAYSNELSSGQSQSGFSMELTSVFLLMLFMLSNFTV